jgi:IS30 family transposase
MTMGTYKQLSRYDRKIIEEALDEGLSFRTIAKLLERQASSVSREVKANRSRLKGKGSAKMAECSERNFCKRKGLCDSCPFKGRLCLNCTEFDCRVLCDTYISQKACPTLSKGRYVCNGCEKRAWGCTRPLRFEYRAPHADMSAKDRRSICRQGFDCTPEAFEKVMEVVRPALSRGLSPYEIATAFSEKVCVSESTLYRWVDRGYGGMANIELERKVGFSPRKKTEAKAITHHGPKRSYEAFSALDAEERAQACEMDTVVGRKRDRKCILTLYLCPAHFQLYILLEKKTKDEVARAFDTLERILGLELFLELVGLIVTDNGLEFEDTERLEASATVKGKKRCRVFYCDPRQSQQKPGCEKNHTELRQILPKRSVHFDTLVGRDASVACSHVNSTPRRSLCGMSPLQMLKAAYGKRIDVLLDAYGIEEIGPDELTLKPWILNKERQERGEEPLEF